ncbi:MAG: response regulator [Anaerolineaceae bacterium]|nr:response regulator [Anaerolineaceae bacterium]
MTKYHILIIEDNLDNLELVRFLLEKASFVVSEALDGRHGLELARRDKPDLILLDLTIPEIDGWTLAQKLKADPLTETIPIVALTAHTLPSDRKRALDAGCNGYLSKPLDISTFIPQISAFIVASNKTLRLQN